MKFVEVRDIRGNTRRVPVYGHPEERERDSGFGKDGRKRAADPGRNGHAEGGSLRDILNHSDRF